MLRIVIATYPVVELSDIALQVRDSSPACSMSLRRVCTGPHGAVKSWLLPYLQQNGWKGCSHHCFCQQMSPSLPFRSERGRASGVAPSRSAVAILHCTFCANSVGDLCIAVQYVPVPGPPALSMMACCSGGILLCSFAACTASAAAKILDCSFAGRRVPSKALRRDIVRRLHKSRADDLCSPRLSAAHGLASYNLLALFSIVTLAYSSTATPAAGRSAFEARAVASSGCGSRSGRLGATQMFDMTALCRSTADQYVACAAQPI